MENIAREHVCLLLIEMFTISTVALAQNLSGSDCLECHNEPTLTKQVDGKEISLFVDKRLFEGSVHNFLGCVDCHSDVRDYPHQPVPKPVACSQCHPDTQQAYDKGLHAEARHKGNLKAATCLDCHDSAHGILPVDDPQSKANHGNVPQTCGACHGQKFVMEGSGLSAAPFFSYQESVHGRAVAAGSGKAAVCVNCHRSHDVRSPADPESSIFKFNVPQTCGQCHESEFTQYLESIHGQAIERGNWESPVCTDCHGIHTIKSQIDPQSSVAAQALARTTCAQCHEGVRLTQEFGVPGHRITSYLDSYHGLASQLGSRVAANCASCHGVHNILPSSDRRSTINQNNLVKTCGRCHPGASEKFVASKVHVNLPISQDLGSLISYWVGAVYIWLIVVVIGAMVVHNGLIWRKKVLAHRAAQDRSIVRMSYSQRVQHWTLLVSFFLLVITGFALKYPESWVGWFFGSDEAVRGILHRVAGVVLIGLSVYHLAYLVLTKEGRRSWRALRPARKDVRDGIDNFRYYLGLGQAKPQFGQFNYAEKVEYWALVWGVVIMGVTGLMAWFEVQVTWLLPRWTIDVALTIHFYEAVLASLAIVVWHFYQVIFDPDVYPMNWSWWDGRMSVEHFEREHPLAHHEPMRQQDRQKHRKIEPDEPKEGQGYEPSAAGSGDD